MQKKSVVLVLVVAMLLVVGVLRAMGDTAFVDDNDTVVLRGNTHRLALSQPDAALAPASLPMQRMIMSFKIPAAKQPALQAFLRNVYDPSSPSYHHWLTPEEFGAKFGPSRDEVAMVSQWLTSQGFKIDEVAKSRTWINFSGDVFKVENSFKTRIRNLRLGDRIFDANDSDPSIPRALSGIVSGVVTLHDIPRQPKHHLSAVFPTPDSVPNYTAGSSHYLAPGDFASIYNVKALYDAGIDGSGQSIAIVGRTYPSTSNWSSFRSTMGLPANPPQVIVNGPNPGDLGSGEDTEADLDVEWSGAVARNATIKFVTSASTYSTDGVDLSAQYIVNNNVAPIMSISFGSCESDMGASENAFYNNLWSQAAAQGITVLVSAGDAGAAACSDPGGSTGSGRAVNGLASTPYNIAVGGTQFNEGSGTFWNSTNSSTEASALGYIPELAWNESGLMSGGSGLWATGGGVSQIYSKPAWQAAPGVPQDGHRDIPDVSLSAASHDGYLIYSGGYLAAVGGTSAASPSMAGVMALVLQKNNGQRLGNANVQLYKLASNQYTQGGASVFHDITASNNSVPGVTGYYSGTAYDLATGLGSVDAYALVNNWNTNAQAQPDFTLNAIPSVTVAAGKSGAAPVQVGVSGGFSAAVSLSVSGVPSGVTANFTPSGFAAPGSGSASLAFSAAASASPGSYPLTVTASGGGVSHSQNLYLTVTGAADFTLNAVAPATVKQGGSGSVNIGTTVANGFNSAVSLAVSGLPSGLSASFAPATIAAPGNGSSTLTLSSSSSAPLGTSYLTVTASGGGISHSQTFAVSVTASADFTLSAGSLSALKQGTAGSVSVSTATVNGFNSALSLAVSGLPSGVSASFAPATVAAPGGGNSTLTLSVSSSAAVGSGYLTVTATGGGISHSKALYLTVTSAANLTVSAVNPGTVAFCSSGGAGSASIQASGAWSATTPDSWVSLTSGAGNGNGTLAFNVARNGTGAPRNSTVTVGGTTLTVLQAKGEFGDVVNTYDNWAYPYVCAIYAKGITMGCDQSGSSYCPGETVTREQMAAFLVRAQFTDNFTIASTVPYYNDVDASSPYFRYVQKMYEQGLAAAQASFNPSGVVTRDQMAAFIIRALFGENFTYTQTPYFSDVPASSVFFKYIQKMKDLGLTANTGLYAPSDYVTRAQMAAFLSRAFLGMK